MFQQTVVQLTYKNKTYRNKTYRNKKEIIYFSLANNLISLCGFS